MRNAQRLAIFAVILALAGVRPAALQAAPVVTAKSAILIDNQTGQVLWERNADWELPPASTTKIVTALLALQSGRLDESISVTPQAAQMPPSKIGVRVGWKMRLRDLVYAVLLNSANDASVVIAEGLSGNVRDFAERMNAEARVLGATHTHFVNPNGLPADNHYSTARDLATMFRKAMQNPLFEAIVSTKTTSVTPTAGSFKRIALHNHNRLLGAYRIQVVGKTGWTIAAKKCFVGAASANGRQIGVAVLGSRDLWGDLRRLLDFAFEGTPLPENEPPQLQAAAIGDEAAAGDEDEPRSIGHSPRYSVAVALLRDVNAATSLRDSLRRAGYHAVAQPLGRGRHRRFRVVVGSYANRREAQQVAARLRATHHRTTTVVIASN